MQLILLNGYPPYMPQDPAWENDAYDLAATGIWQVIEGVRHFQWLHELTIEFKDELSYVVAKAATGWNELDRSRLLLVASTSSAEGHRQPAIVTTQGYVSGEHTYPVTYFCGFTLCEPK